MKKIKTFLAVLLIAALVASGFSVTFKDELIKADELSCMYLTGKNVGYNDYLVRAVPVYSYLVSTESGFMRVQGNAGDNGFSISYYDADYNLTKRQTIPAELPKFGGFFADDSAYYVVTGQSNPDQKDNLEVFRITKYDKSWNRIGSGGLYGANTTVPFNAGSCRMDIDGKYLIVRTCHTMYKSSDGLNHQANVTIEVDTSSMTVTDSYTIVMNTSVGYVSHSFNQFVKIENHSIVSVDHGDAHPRSICFMKYSSDISGGKFQGSVKCINVLSFPGATGTNSTGASVGGFEIADSNYLIAGNSVVQDDKNLERKTRNIFVAAVDKSTDAVNINWLTDYAEGESSASTPHMVKLSNGSFMILWGRGEKVYYTLVDGTGKASSETYSMDGQLSDCVPVISNNKLVWYTWDNGIEKFYEIPLSSLSEPTVKTISFEHEYERESIKNGVVTLKCKKCGEKKSGNIVSDFSMYWKKSQDTGSYWSYTPKDIQKEDVIVFLCKLKEGYSDEPEFKEMIFESSDPEHCITDSNERKISFNLGGQYDVKVYPKYNPEIAKTYTFSVNPLPTQTPTATPTPTASVSPTATPTVSVSPTATPTGSVSPTAKPTASVSPTAKPTVSVSPTAKPTASVSPTAKPTVSVSPTVKPTSSVSPTATPTTSVSPTAKPTASVSPTATPTATVTPTAVPAPTSVPVTSVPAPTITPTTVTPTSAITPTVTPTESVEPTQVPTITATPTPTPYVAVEMESDGGIITETSFYEVKDKIKIEVKSYLEDSDKSDEAAYIGIGNDAVKIESFSGTGKTVSIPEYVEAQGNRYYVTTIGKNILGYSDCIKTVKLGSSVTSIAKSAFRNEKKLRRIEIYAANLKYVGKKAFKGIYSKAKIVLIGTKEQCENAEKLIRASGIGKRIKIIYNII